MLSVSVLIMLAAHCFAPTGDGESVERSVRPLGAKHNASGARATTSGVVGRQAAAFNTPNSDWRLVSWNSPARQVWNFCYQLRLWKA
jgi:hypothetical protein